MREIRFHGRGGQGSVVASELLAQAAYLDGKWPQSFPFFGVERRGAPVTAYARIDDRPVAVRTAIATPEIVVVLDPGLVRAVPVTEGLRPGGLLLLNTARPVVPAGLPDGVRLATVDANRIALAHGLGSPTMPIVNTAMLGALAAASGVVSLAALEAAIEAYVPARPAENRAAARDGAAAVKVGPAPASSPPGPRPAPVPLVLPDAPLAAVPSGVLHTAAWRTLRPEIDLARCTRCEFCWKFCPDDAIALDADGYPSIRLQYCKGCGICAEECPPSTIRMVPEEGAA